MIAVVTGASRGIGAHIATALVEKVASVTIDCIRKNKAEVIVNAPPVRPLIALANLFSSVTPKLLRWFGYTGTFEKVIDKGLN